MNEGASLDSDYVIAIKSSLLAKTFFRFSTTFISDTK